MHWSYDFQCKRITCFLSYRQQLFLCFCHGFFNDRNMCSVQQFLYYSRLKISIMCLVYYLPDLRNINFFKKYLFISRVRSVEDFCERSSKDNFIRKIDMSLIEEI